ncbi:YitT family protein [Bacillota bacterium Lsc_1132]
MINHFIPINTGLIILMINIPLFILGYFHLGKKFMFLTIYSIVLLSVAMKLIPVPALSQDTLVSCLFFGGGLLSETKETIRHQDPTAFVHITKAIEVMGRFRKE